MRLTCPTAPLSAVAICTILAVCLCSAPVFAVAPATWEHQSEADFSEGEFDATAVTSLGEIRLAQQLELLLGAEQAPAVVSAVIRGGQDVYAASGTEAKVYRVQKGKAELLAALPGAMATCLLWRDGELLVGTGGEEAGIYRVSPAGQVTRLWSQADAQYVWAIVPGPGEILYTATGPQGQVFAVAPDGQARTIYQAGKLAKNILCLAAADDATLYAGTDEEGLVVRIDPNVPSARIILDAEEDEISALVPDEAGGLYVATADAAKASADGTTQPARTTPGRAVSEPDVETPTPPTQDEPEPTPQPETDAPAPLPKPTRQVPAADPTASADEESAQLPVPLPDPQPQASSPTTAPADTEQSVSDETEDESADETPDESFAEQDEDDEDDETGPDQAPARAPTARRARSAAQTGGPGNAVYYIRPDGLVETRFRRPVAVLSMIYDSPANRLLLGTGNGGAIYSVSADGDEVVQLADTEAKQVTALAPLDDGRILLATANGGSVGVLGRDLTDRGTYTSTVLDAGQIARWGTAGVRATLTADAPAGNTVTLATRSGNVSDADEGGWSEWSPPAPVDGPLQQTPIASPPARFLQYRLELIAEDGRTPAVRDVRLIYQVGNLPPVVAAVEVKPSDKGAARNITTGGPQAFRHIAIKAGDPNEDEISYDIDFRQVGTQTWVRIAEDLDEPKHVWDTRTVADGAYELRVQASDTPSNPPASALTAARISNIVVVDNTPPVVSELGVKKAASPGGVLVSGRISDAGSRIVEIAYSVDSQEDWTAVAPTDGICDSGSEAFAFTLEELSAGPHRIAVRASDLLGNVVYASIAVTP